MKCEKCGKPLLAEELFCKECGHEQAYHDQRKVLVAAEEKRKNFIKRKCHSPLFLIMAICFTIITVFNIANIIPAIFMIITTVGLWRCYAAKSDETLVKGLKNMKAFDMYTRVCYYIVMGIYSLFFVLFLFSTIGSCATVNSQIESSEVTTAALVSCLIALVVYGIVVGIIELFCSIYKHRLDFLDVLKISVLNGTQYALSFSKVGSYFIGITLILPGIVSIILSIISSITMGGAMGGLDAIIIPLIESLDLGSDIEPLLEMITFLFSGAGSFIGILVAILANLGSIAFGLYYILSAEWMGSARDEGLIVIKRAEDEKKKLAEIEKETRRQIRIFNQKNNPEPQKEPEKKPEPAPKTESNDVDDEKIAYSIAKDGKASNPITVKKLREMALSGELLPESMLWRRGMSTWVRADQIDELKDSFPPPIDMPEPEFDPSEAPAIPMNEAPVEEAPVEEATVEETPAEEAPVEEATVEETPAEEAPADEAPVEEAPAEEAPVEEAPAEEAPAEEKVDE